MRTAIVMATCAVCLPLPAFARQAEQPAEKQAVVFSASGGTSKGSFQAGGDWVISEFLRRQRADPAFRSRALLTKELELKAVTGASAGNVNALVAAVNWCTRSAQGETEIPAEKSLFWKIGRAHV